MPKLSLYKMSSYGNFSAKKKKKAHVISLSV